MAIEKCFLDANILIDHILIRKPFEQMADEIFNLAEQGSIISSCSMTTVTTVSYYAEQVYSILEIKDFFRKFSSFCDILPVTKDNLIWAVNSKFDDLEDAIQNHVAESNGYGTIITRNKKDFKKSNLAILTPQEFLATL